MRIICPICDAQYDLPPALAAKLPARTRCARCGAEWEAQPAEPASAAASTAPAPIALTGFEQTQVGQTQVGQTQVGQTQVGQTQIGQTQIGQTHAEQTPGEGPIAPVPGGARVIVDRYRPAPLPNNPQEQRQVRTLWLGSVALVGLLVILFLGFHGPIGQAWPPSLRLYQALGLG